MTDTLSRIQIEARGTSAHNLIVEHLKEKRHARLEQVSGSPKEDLLAIQSDVRLLDEIIRDLTREPVDIKKFKSGAYTV